MKWGRALRFRLTAAGREAGRVYRQEIVASRAEAGRKSFDAAASGWAARLSLQPADGVVLGELLDAPRTLAEITASLDGCGPEKTAVRATIERLLDLRMMEMVEPPPPPAPPPRRW